MHLYVSNRPNHLGSGPVSPSNEDASGSVVEGKSNSTPDGRTNALSATTWERMDNGWAYMQGDRQIGYLLDDRTFFWLKADGTFSEAQRLQPGQTPKR